VLLTFNRLKQLTTDEKEVSRAMLESSSVVMSSDMSMLRRKAPLPQTDESRACMVYLKGFPVDLTLDDLVKWGPTGDVARYVQRHVQGQKDKLKPSIFMEMKTPAAAQALVEQHKATPIEFRGTALSVVMLRDDYLRGKRESKAASRGAAPGKASRKVREEDLMAGFVRDKVPNAIAKFKGLPEDTDGDGLDSALRVLSDIKFVELVESEPDAAIIRTASAGAAALLVRTCEELKALQAASKPLDSVPEGVTGLDAEKLAARKSLVEACCNKVPDASLLAGEEEDAYWQTVWALQAKKFRARQLQRMKRTERDVIPAGTPVPEAEAAAPAPASASTETEAAAAPETEAAAAPETEAAAAPETEAARPEKRSAEESQASDGAASSSSSAAAAGEGDSAAKKSKPAEE
jgi:hypothetical protein